MRASSLPLAILLLTVSGCASIPASRTGPAQPALTRQTRNSGGVMPSAQQRVHFDHAELHIRVVPAQRRIEGRARLTFTALRATHELLLDLDRNLPISGVAVNGKALDPASYSNPDGRLHIVLPAALATGDSVVAEVHYAGQPHVAKRAPWDGGFVWSKTPDGQPWVASAVEGEGCDLFWPCIDNPQGEPDQVDLYVTVPKPLVAPGNGAFVGVSDDGDQRTWHWRARHPDTYAIAINVGPYKHLQAPYKSRYGNTIEMDYWYLPGEDGKAQTLFASFPRMLDFFEQEIGPYPFGDEKMGVVETPYLGMEHQTINAYGNHYARDGNGFDRLLQHEFAHEWFGNQMTNADWTDMWLHEGFGTYMQPLYSQYLHGDRDYFSWLHNLRLLLRNRNPLVGSPGKTEEQVYDEQHGPGQDIYNKGALILHSLRQLIGDEAFFKSIRLLVYGRDDPAPGNFQPRYATTREYIDIVDNVTGRKLDWFFKVYLNQAALPELKVQHQGDKLRLQWTVPQDLPFPMPVEVQVGYTVHTLPMTDGSGSLTVPAGTLLIIDPHSKLLRKQAYVTDFQQWIKHQRMQRRDRRSTGSG